MDSVFVEDLPRESTTFAVAVSVPGCAIGFFVSVASAPLIATVEPWNAMVDCEAFLVALPGRDMLLTLKLTPDLPT